MPDLDRGTRVRPPVETVRASLDRAVALLLASSLETGEIPMAVSRDRRMAASQRDATPFATTFAIEALAPVALASSTLLRLNVLVHWSFSRLSMTL